MGNQSKKKKQRTSRQSSFLAGVGMPPTLKTIERLKQRAGRRPGDEKVLEVLRLHPDYEDSENAQMTFDQAIFKLLPGASLLRHPYEGEIDLKQMYEQENGKGSATNQVLLLHVSCLMPGEGSVRYKEPRALGPEDILYEPLSQGQCAILGENPDGAVVYGLLFQRLPIEIVATGVVPV